MSKEMSKPRNRNSDGMTEEEADDSSDVEHAREAYRTTKAMGDADRQVCLN
jgi:hypothetical protein